MRVEKTNPDHSERSDGFLVLPHLLLGIGDQRLVGAEPPAAQVADLDGRGQRAVGHVPPHRAAAAVQEARHFSVGEKCITLEFVKIGSLPAGADIAGEVPFHGVILV